PPYLRPVVRSASSFINRCVTASSSRSPSVVFVFLELAVNGRRGRSLQRYNPSPHSPSADSSSSSPSAVCLHFPPLSSLTPVLWKCVPRLGSSSKSILWVGVGIYVEDLASRKRMS
ncbi:hypothetical protein S245_065755, partial [Arachis hypogaea]